MLRIQVCWYEAGHGTRIHPPVSLQEKTFNHLKAAGSLNRTQIWQFKLVKVADSDNDVKKIYQWEASINFTIALVNYSEYWTLIGQFYYVTSFLLLVALNAISEYPIKIILFFGGGGGGELKKNFFFI